MRTLNPRWTCALAALLLSISCAKERKPAIIEAESLQGVSGAANYGVTASTGWGSYMERSYSGDRAALTRAGGAVASGHIPDFHKGNYRAEVVVFNYPGGGRNSFVLTLGGLSKTLKFGGKDSPAGVIRLGDLYFENVENDGLSIRAVGIGQTFLVVDRLRLLSYDGKIPSAKSVWEQTMADIQGDDCHNCVQGESLKPVAADANYGRASGEGWASYGEGSYSEGRAAITRLPGAIMSGHIPNFRPGAYRAVVVGYNYPGGGQNSFDLQLGTETKRITYGGPGFAPGVTHLNDLVFNAVGNGLIAVKAGAIGQPFLIIDAFSLDPLATPPAPSKQAYTIAEAEPIVEQCQNCVEAETLHGVSADANYGNASGSGWASYEQETFSKKRAALTRMPGAMMSGRIPGFRPGDYKVTLTVLNYDTTKRNTMEMTLGGVARQVTFGPGLPTGVVRLRNLLFSGVKTADLQVKAVSIEQAYAIIDTISLQSTSP